MSAPKTHLSYGGVFVPNPEYAEWKRAEERRLVRPSMRRRKPDSKRRWLARFRIGRPVPWLAMEEHPDLKDRLKPARFLINMDAICHA